MTDKEKVKLSTQQGDVYTFVSDYITDNNRSPNYKEIASYLKVSEQRVVEIVRDIIKKGWFYFTTTATKRKIRIKKI